MPWISPLSLLHPTRGGAVAPPPPIDARSSPASPSRNPSIPGSQGHWGPPPGRGAVWGQVGAVGSAPRLQSLFSNRMDTTVTPHCPQMRPIARPDICYQMPIRAAGRAAGAVAGGPLVGGRL